MYIYNITARLWCRGSVTTLGLHSPVVLSTPANLRTPAEPDTGSPDPPEPDTGLVSAVACLVLEGGGARREHARYSAKP
jgi:hypothetical protein